MTFWAYMLHCRGGVFYIGHTDDLERRVGGHQSGQIKGFTSRYLPVTLVWCQEFPTRLEALEAERRIKGWSRAKKLALIRGDWTAISTLAKGRSGPSTSSGRTGKDVAGDPNSVRAELVEASPFDREKGDPSTSSGRTEGEASSLRHSSGQAGRTGLGGSAVQVGRADDGPIPERRL